MAPESKLASRVLLKPWLIFVSSHSNREGPLRLERIPNERAAMSDPSTISVFEAEHSSFD